jgi:hypothetical protein
MGEFYKPDPTDNLAMRILSDALDVETVWNSLASPWSPSRAVRMYFDNEGSWEVPWPPRPGFPGGEDNWVFMHRHYYRKRNA